MEKKQKKKKKIFFCFFCALFLTLLVFQRALLSRTMDNSYGLRERESSVQKSAPLERAWSEWGPRAPGLQTEFLKDVVCCKRSEVWKTGTPRVAVNPIRHSTLMSEQFFGSAPSNLLMGLRMWARCRKVRVCKIWLEVWQILIYPRIVFIFFPQVRSFVDWCCSVRTPRCQFGSCTW